MGGKVGAVPLDGTTQLNPSIVNPRLILRTEPLAEFGGEVLGFPTLPPRCVFHSLAQSKSTFSLVVSIFSDGSKTPTAYFSALYGVTESSLPS